VTAVFVGHITDLARPSIVRLFRLFCTDSGLKSLKTSVPIFSLKDRRGSLQDIRNLQKMVRISHTHGLL